MATGDIPLGAQRHRENRVRRLENNIKKRESAGLDSEKTKKKLEAQKAKNADIEKYLSTTSTGKILLQNYLLTGYGADAYRASRARGADRGRAFLETMMPNLNLNPLNNESILQKREDKKKYGAIAHEDI